MTGVSQAGLVAGVDVGGTFTDLVIFDPATGAVRLAKVPTTLPNQSGGVLAAFDAAGADLAGIDLIVHGTTTTTNAVLERQLARTGLITTAGLPRRAGAWPPHPPASLRHARPLHPGHPARPAAGSARADGRAGPGADPAGRGRPARRHRRTCATRAARRW